MKKKLSSEEVGHRIKVFSYEKFGSIENLAKALGVGSTTLKSNYISGRSLPGAQILYNLMNLGCDINWLLTGIRIDKTKSETDLIKELTYFKEENVRLLKEIIELEKLLRSHNKVAEQTTKYLASKEK